jgi:hypothetical protein
MLAKFGGKLTIISLGICSVLPSLDLSSHTSSICMLGPLEVVLQLTGTLLIYLDYFSTNVPFHVVSFVVSSNSPIFLLQYLIRHYQFFISDILVFISKFHLSVYIFSMTKFTWNIYN